MKATVNVFFSPMCPHCPSAKKLAAEVAKERADVEVKEINTMTNEGAVLAQKFGIMSVPTIVVFGEGQPIGMTGTPSKGHFNKAIDIALGKDKFPN
jgi:small redox-active disulfide protein 1